LISEGPLNYPVDKAGSYSAAIVSFGNRTAYDSYTLTFPVTNSQESGFVLGEVELLSQSPFAITNGKLPSSLPAPITSLTFGGVSYKPDELELSLDQTNKQATIKGRSSTVKGSAIDLGPIGFGVDADTTDSDSRVGSEIVIKDGRMQAFSLPLTELSDSNFAFTNRGSDQSKFMTATFEPKSFTYKVKGSSQQLVRKGSTRNISHPSDTTLKVDVALSNEGLHLVNGQLTNFSIPVESFSLRANGLQRERLEFTPVPGASKPLTASFSVVKRYDPKTKYTDVKYHTPDKTIETFEITGQAKVVVPTGYHLSDPKTVTVDAELGGNGTTGLVLTDVRKKDGSVKSNGKVSFAITEYKAAGTTFRGVDLAVTYDTGSYSFQYSGGAKWTFGKQTISAIPLAGRNPSTLAGFTLHGQVKFNGLAVHSSGTNVFFVSDSKLAIWTAGNLDTTVSVNGKSAPVTFNRFFIHKNKLNLTDAPYLTTPEAFSLAGIALENPKGFTSTIHFPNTSSKNSAHFLYKGSNVDFTLGDITSQASAKVPLILGDGKLTVGDAAEFEFVKEVEILGYKFKANALKATYSSGRFTFVGPGSYRGVSAVTFGTDPKGPQLIMERGVPTVRNYTPPKILESGGVVVPRDGLPETSHPSKPNHIVIKGERKMFVGGTTITAVLGGGKTQGLVLDVSDKNNEKIVAIGATIKGSFTVGGVVISASGELNWDRANDQIEITGAATFAFKAAGETVTLAKVDLGTDAKPGLIIKNGQITHLNVSASGDFKLFGFEVEIKDLNINYKRERQEFRLSGKIEITAKPVFKGFEIELGTKNSPGLIIRNGELERLDVKLDDTIDLYGAKATPDNLRMVYSRSTNLLALTGGLKMTFANHFKAKAAFPGQGLLINTATGQVQVKGLKLKVENVTIGVLEIRKLEFRYEVDNAGNKTIEGGGELSLPGGITVGAEITIKNGRLSRISFTYEKSPGIQIGQTGVFLLGIEGELNNLDDLANFSISATVTATAGPSMKIFGETRALVEIDGSIFISKEKLEIEGKVQLLEGVFGNGRGKITVFFSGHQVLHVQAKFSLYPGGIFRGDLDFTLNRDFGLHLEGRLGVHVPDFIPVIGGQELGSTTIILSLHPKKPPKDSYVFFLTYISLPFCKTRFDAAVVFDGQFGGRVFKPCSTSNVWFDFSLRIPGLREFLIPEIAEDTVDVPYPTLDITSVAPTAGTPGAVITYSGTSELPADTTIDLYVDTEPNGYGGERIATDISFQADEQTFTWKDLAAYASVPYDPNKPVYVYGAINDGTNFPVFTPYSDPIVPPDYTPIINVPAKEDYGTNQALIFSKLKDNAIQIDDPLAQTLPDSEVFVELSAHHGTLSLKPEHAKPWQNRDNPLDVSGDGTVGPLDVLQLISLQNASKLLSTGGRLPESRSAASDLPFYDVNGDGLATPLDVLLTIDGVNGNDTGPTAGASVANVQVEGDGTEVITLTGRAADVNAMLDGLTYQPYENNFFDDAIDISVNRYPEFYVETVDASIPLKAHPLTLDTDDDSSLLPVTYEQNSGHQQLLGHVMIHDAASGHISGAVITIGNYEKGKDLLELNLDDQLDQGIHSSFNADTGILRLSGFASVEEYQSALHLISFCSTGTGEKTLTVKVGDDVNDLAEFTETIYMIELNQPPEVDPGIGAVYPANSAPINLLSSIEVRDPEGQSIAWATIALDASTYVQGKDVLRFLDQPGVTGQFDAATGVMRLTGPASDFEFNTALQSVTYHNTSANPATGIRELTVTVSDGAARNAETTVRERLMIVDASTNFAAPVIDGLPTALVETPKDSTPVVLAPDLTLSDTGTLVPTLMNAVVRITDGFTSGADFLNVKGLPDGIEASYDPFHGVLFLSGSASISYYEYALRQVTYSNQETVRNGLQRKVEFDVNDGFTIATPGELTLEPESLPVVEAGFGALVYEHGQKSVDLNPGVTVKYAALPILTGASVKFVWGYLADQDRLEYTEQKGITGSFDQQTGTLTLSGTAPVEDYQDALRSVKYHNTRVNPIPGTREIEYTAIDNQEVSDSGEMMLSNYLIDVATQYVPPVLTLDSTALTFVENSDPLVVAPSFTITDQDTPLPDGSGTIRLDGATVRIDGYVEGEDFLSFTPVGDIDGEFDAHQGELFLAGHASLTDYQTVMRSIAYQNVSEAPTTASRGILITLQEGAVDAAAPRITVEVQSLNNPPTRTGAAPADITVLENVASVSLGLENVSYDPPSAKEPDLVFTTDIVPDPELGHVRFSDGVIAEVAQTYTLDQLHSATFVPALNAAGDTQFVYTVAGFNPILQMPDPAHLTESVNIHVVGVPTTNAADAFVAQIHRDLLGRNPTAADFQAAVGVMSDKADREAFVSQILAGQDYKTREIAHMYDDFLNRSAKAGEVEALFIPPFALSEDFSDTTLSDSLNASDPSAISLTNGTVAFTGDRNFVRTELAEYWVHDFTAEVTVTVGADSTAAPADQVVYFGMSPGEPDTGNNREPDPTALVGLRLAPDGFTFGGTATADISDDDVRTQPTADVGGSGTHRLRMAWDATNETATFAVDQDYTGGNFVADKTFDPIDGSDNGFDLDNSKVFFGGAGGATFDDLEITGAPLDLKLDEVQSRILASDEYFLERGHGTHEGLVNAMYDDLLGREPTDAEMTEQVKHLLEAGGVVELANSLAFSNEGAVRAVDDIHGRLLRRPGELFDLVDQARILQSKGTAEIMKSVVASDEYYTRYGTQTSADQRSLEEIEQELILQWLMGEGTPGNSG